MNNELEGCGRKLSYGDFPGIFSHCYFLCVRVFIWFVRIYHQGNFCARDRITLSESAVTLLIKPRRRLVKCRRVTVHRNSPAVTTKTDEKCK